MAEAPRVTCTDCESAWFGSITAHGLSVIGHCPRCGGQLHFREVEAEATAPREPAATNGEQPWLVLGRPPRP